MARNASVPGFAVELALPINRKDQELDGIIRIHAADLKA